MRKPVITERKPGIAARAIAGVRAAPPKPRKPLPTMAPADDPIDDDAYPGTLEGDAAAELDQLSTGFKERAKAEAERFKTATDPFFYTVLVFESGPQCSAFIDKLGLGKGGDLFIDGRKLADMLDVELPKADAMRYNAGPTKPSSWSEFVRTPKPTKRR